MNTTKPWLSKTIIVNTIGGVTLALSAFVPSLAGVQSFLTQNAVMIGMIWSVLNIALRTLTKNAISLQD